MPWVRFDFATLDLESDVEALDFRLQGGQGPLAVEINPTFYEESNPDDNLDIYRFWALWRVPMSNNLEVDLGAGGIHMEGNETNLGTSFTVPVLYQPYDWLVLEARGIWSQINDSDLSEYEAGVLLNWESIAIKAGYRWTCGPNTSLDGPFFGMSIRL